LGVYGTRLLCASQNVVFGAGFEKTRKALLSDDNGRESFEISVKEAIILKDFI
jgi:hypothetical protein